MSVCVEKDARVVWALLELLKEEILWCQCVRGSGSSNAHAYSGQEITTDSVLLQPQPGML
jgi:hypothetical protein